MLIAFVGSWAYPRMEIFADPSVTTSTKDQPAFRRDLKVEGSRARIEAVLPPWPGNPPTVFSNDDGER